MSNKKMLKFNNGFLCNKPTVPVKLLVSIWNPDTYIHTYIHGYSVYNKIDWICTYLLFVLVPMVDQMLIQWAHWCYRKMLPLNHVLCLTVIHLAWSYGNSHWLVFRDRHYLRIFNKRCKFFWLFCFVSSWVPSPIPTHYELQLRVWISFRDRGILICKCLQTCNDLIALELVHLWET